MAVFASSLIWIGFAMFMFIMGSEAGRRQVMEAAARRDLAYYDPKTGEWKWKEPTK